MFILKRLLPILTILFSLTLTTYGGSSVNGEDTKYTVSFYDSGEFLPQFSLAVESGREIPLPAYAKGCFTFEGWRLNGSGQLLTGSYKVKSDLRFDVKFSVIDIRTHREFYNIRDNLSGNYRLTDNISLSDYSAGAGWLPIGGSAAPFTGCLDGNGFKITDLFVDASDKAAGLFGYMNGKIINLVVETKTNGVNVNSSGNGYAGIIAGYVRSGTISNSYAAGTVTAAAAKNSRAGGLAGEMHYGSVTNSYATASVTASSAADSSSAGGLVGWMGGSIINSYAAGSVTASSHSNSFSGGLVGEGYGSISNSHSTNTVTAAAAKNSSAGGLAGQLYGEYGITSSYAAGSVTASSAADSSYAGGVAGLMEYGSIIDSYATGSVTAASTSDYYSFAGGLVGESYGSITNSHATGTVTASAAKYSRAGGLAGQVYGENSITDSYATGYITASAAEELLVGGLVGRLEFASIINSYATGSVTVIFSDFSCHVGGLVGRMEFASIINSYAAGSVTAAAKYSRVGGLVGEMGIGTENSIANSFATGSVTSSSAAESSAAGGLVGWMDRKGIITNSYALGSVTSSSNSHSFAGGIAGEGYGNIINSMAANSGIKILQGQYKYMGRIANVYINDSSDGIKNNNFALDTMQAVGGSFNTASAYHGTDKTENELKTFFTYEGKINGDGLGGLGWQFCNGATVQCDDAHPWKMPAAGAGFPILYWQP